MTEGSGGYAGRRATRSSRIFGLLAGFGLAVSLTLAPPAAAIARAADPELPSRGSTTYVVQLSRHLIAVDIDQTVTDVKPDTATTAYYFTGLSVYLQPSATHIRATGEGHALATTISHVSGQTRVTVSFSRSVYHAQTYRFHVQFDLPGGEPRSTSAVRVGAALVTFVAWSFPDTGSVRIELPPGYEHSVQGGPLEMAGSLAAGEVLTADDVESGNDWYAVVTGEREAGLTTTPLTISGAHLSIHGWPEDPTWSTRVRDRLSRGVPILTSLIGRDWPVPDDVAVTERSPEVLDGYAGFYYDRQHAIEISEELDDLTILHEASHAWFNGALFDDRWVDEGLANVYSSLALTKLGLTWTPFTTPNRNGPIAFALADWAAPSAITDATQGARETYGYDASTHVIQMLVDKVGVTTLGSVFAAAFDDEIAYLGRPAPEDIAPPSTSWQRFLDLVDERSGTSDADPLFAAWVVPPSAKDLMAIRASARSRYLEVLDHGDGWLMPLIVRRPMSTWDFHDATDALGDAEAVLTTRDSIERQAASLGIAAPPELQEDYETAADDLTHVQTRADLELATIGDIVSADAAVKAATAPGDISVQVGLVGAPDPAARIAAAEAAFTADDLPGARIAANDARALVGGLAETGRIRITAAATGAIVIVLTALVLVAVLLRRRRRPGARVSGAMAAVAAPTMASAVPPPPGPVPSTWYGTLAASLPGEGDPAAGGPIARPPETESAVSQPGEAPPDEPGDER